jgi:hypothetical protein
MAHPGPVPPRQQPAAGKPAPAKGGAAAQPVPGKAKGDASGPPKRDAKGEKILDPDPK